MSDCDVLIVGAGLLGTAVAHRLVQKGLKVTLVEKGSKYPYPHKKQFKERVHYLYRNREYDIPKDLKNHVLSGIYDHHIENERYMRVGGSGTMWEAITLRMRPEDFRLKSVFGVGRDWPLSYEDLEPYYSYSERFLGVSGTDEDNPFSPHRSSPYPLPPFNLSYGDKVLAEVLKGQGIVMHTTPQARTRKPYDGRPACVNYGFCNYCPIGARYSPNHHISRMLKQGLITLKTGVSVRRIIFNSMGRATGVLLRENDGRSDQELSAKCVILAAGGLETPRIMLLSKDGVFPDGPGNQGGQLGRNLTFHHIWRGRLRFKDPLYPGRFGGWTGQSHQFLSPEGRGRHGGCKIELSSHIDRKAASVKNWTSGNSIVEDIKPLLNWRKVGFHCETLPGDEKSLALSEKNDRFGDPFVEIRYDASEFDHGTYGFVKKLMERFAFSLGAQEDHLNHFEKFDSGCHHMGTCTMGSTPDESVANEFGQVHGSKNLFLVGGSVFVGTSGSFNPSLTMLALGFRTADYILDRGVDELSS